MPDIWGTLPKAQDDNQLISEAITVAITDHEADAAAHLGAGEALQSHAASEIIDHVVGSVVADKLSHQDFMNFCSFESLDNWDVLGTVTLDGWPGVKLYTEVDGVLVSQIKSVVKHSGNFLDYTKTLIFQTVFWLDSELNTAYWCGLGWRTSDTNLEGFGFYYNNGDLKGFWGKGATVQYTAAITVNLAICHVFRAQFDPLTKTVYFYIDGVEVASLYNATLPSDIEPIVWFRSDNLALDDAMLVYVRNVMVSRTA